MWSVLGFTSFLLNQGATDPARRWSGRCPGGVPRWWGISMENAGFFHRIWMGFPTLGMLQDGVPQWCECYILVKMVPMVKHPLKILVRNLSTINQRIQPLIGQLRYRATSCFFFELVIDFRETWRLFPPLNEVRFLLQQTFCVHSME